MKLGDEVRGASAQPSPPGSLAPGSTTATREAAATHEAVGTCETVARETIDWRDRWTPPFALEALVGLGLASFALFHLALHMHAMATTGLWSDEIASIRDFSGQGLRTTLTRYPAPNNHIFFNALNALMDWREPYAPLAARSWSFVAMGALFAAGFLGFARRRSFLEAGLFAYLVFMSSELVSLGLQARGYGFLMLFSLASGLFVWWHEREPARALPYCGLAVASVLGIWTIPLYFLFATPAMALCIPSGPWRRNAAIAFGAALLAALLHAPVAREMLAASLRYEGDWGLQFRSLDDVVETLRLYLFHDQSLVHGPNDTWLLLECALLIVLAFSRRASAEARAARTLVASVLVFVALCVALGTPPARTVAPVLVALVFAAGLVLRDRLPPVRFARRRAAIAVGLAAILLPHDERVIDDPGRASWLAG